MTAPDWSRPLWTRGDAKAVVLYFVFGRFAAPLRLDLTAYGGVGLPPGVEMRRLSAATLAHWDGHPLRGGLGDILHAGDPEAFDAANAAPDCLMLRGELQDPDSLTYLRDTLGVVSALLDAGGVTVIDPQILAIFTGAGWRTRYAGEQTSAPRNHVLVMCQADGTAPAWVKTRGMRKFARPDVSIRGVPPESVQRAGEVAAHLAELGARGMRFGEGSTVAAEGLAEPLRVSPAGSLDDPEFNNVHLEVIWPVRMA